MDLEPLHKNKSISLTTSKLAIYTKEFATLNRTHNPLPIATTDMIQGICSYILKQELL
jgi:hypothetical protein